MASLPDPQRSKLQVQSKIHQPPLESILFDLDGTLVNSLPVTIEAFNQGLMVQGYRRQSEAEIIAHFGPGEVKIFENILGQEQAQTAFKVFRNYTNKNLDKILFHNGVLETLAELRKINIPFGLVTGRGQETTHLILDHLGARSWFKVLICHEDVQASKPSPEGILFALEKTGFNPKTCAYLGDMAVDVMAAKGAGIRAIAVTWDLLCQIGLVKNENPDHIFSSPQELLGLI